MALQNTNNEYIIVETNDDMPNDSILLRFYKNEEHRVNEKNDIYDEYLRSKQRMIPLDMDFLSFLISYVSDPHKNQSDNYKTACYIFLKSYDKFSEVVDC